MREIQTDLVRELQRRARYERKELEAEEKRVLTRRYRRIKSWSVIAALALEFIGCSMIAGTAELAGAIVGVIGLSCFLLTKWANVKEVRLDGVTSDK